jgi:hypothetical protein
MENPTFTYQGLQEEDNSSVPESDRFLIESKNFSNPMYSETPIFNRAQFQASSTEGSSMGDSPEHPLFEPYHEREIIPDPYADPEEFSEKRKLVEDDEDDDTGFYR